MLSLIHLCIWNCSVKINTNFLSVSTKAIGPDKISPELSLNLAKQFNRCLKNRFSLQWKVSVLSSRIRESSFLPQYQPISLLSFISKLFKAIINKKMVDHFNINNFLGDKQYIFRSSRFTADILTVIWHRTSEAADNKFITKTIALDTSKSFDKVWYRELLQRLFSYAISGRVPTAINFYSIRKSLKGIVGNQSSDAY